MNKYLMMSAAAVLTTAGGTSAANAGSASFHFANSHSEFCDGGVLKWSGVVNVWTHNFTFGCSFSFNSYGQGISAKNKAFGANVDMSDTYYAHNGNSTASISYDLPKHAAVGGVWTLWYQSHGVSWGVEVNSGVILAGLAKRRPGRAISSVSAVKDIIAKMKAQRS